jgi:integrase
LKLSSATINQRLSALKSLVDYARKRGLCSFTLTDVKGLRSQKYRDTRGRTNDYLLAKLDSVNPALFVSNNGNRLDGKDIARIVKKYAEPVGIDLSPHRVRHSAITAYLDVSEGNVRAAQSLSRHQNLSTLMIYDDNRHQLQGKASKDLGDLLKIVDSCD